MIAAPLMVLHPAGRRLRPMRAVWLLGRLLLSLSGIRVELEYARASVRIHIL